MQRVMTMIAAGITIDDQNDRSESITGQQGKTRLATLPH
jgi:hypothetical protein